MIARADGCILDINRPVIRASFANDLGLSDDEFDDFVHFLADPDACGLIKYENGIITTDRTQEDYGRVKIKRIRDRQNYDSGKGNPDSGNPDSDSGNDTEQSRAEKNRIEQSSNVPAAAFSLSDFKSLLKFHSAFNFSYDNGTYEQLYSHLVDRGCEDPDFIEFCVEKMRASPKRIANPSGFLKTAILQYDDWIDEWKRERKDRVVCPECHCGGGRHRESCSAARAVRQGESRK